MFHTHAVSISFYVVSLTFEVDVLISTAYPGPLMQGRMLRPLENVRGGPSFSLICQGIPRFIDRNKRLAMLASMINVLL